MIKSTLQRLCIHLNIKLKCALVKASLYTTRLYKISIIGGNMDLQHSYVLVRERVGNI